MRKYLAVLAAAVLVAGCDDDFGPQPPEVEVLGTYLMSALTFDPQGSLPPVDLLARLDVATRPRLVMGRNGRAQLVFENPATGLITLANVTYTANPAGEVRIDFASGSNVLYRNVMLSAKMTFAWSEAAGTMTFTGPSPDGVDRSRLLQLVPEWQSEQLFDPVPGELTVVFTIPD